MTKRLIMRNILRICLISFVALFLGLMADLLLSGMSMSGRVEENWIVKQFYSRLADRLDTSKKVEDYSSKHGLVDNTLLLYDIGKNETQLEKIISEFASFEPSVIGLDVIFKRDEIHAIDSNDRMLIDTIKKYHDMIVLAVGEKSSDEPLYSFDYELQHCCEEGIVAVDDSYARFDINGKVYKGDTIKKFSQVIVEKYMKKRHCSWDKSRRYAVSDFRPTYFDLRFGYGNSSIEEINEEVPIKGKIVIIGNSDKYYDNISMPFPVLSQSMGWYNDMVEGNAMGGMLYHAYETRTLMNYLKNTDGRLGTEPLKRMNLVCNLFLNFISLFIYVWILCAIRKYMARKRFKRCVTYRILQPVIEWLIMLAALWFVFFLLRLIIEKSNLIPNAFTLMSSIVFVQIAFQIVTRFEIMLKVINLNKRKKQIININENE